MSLAKYLDDGRNIAVLGQAGTGKSTLCLQQLGTLSKCVRLTAASGVAACNVGGTTLHSFAGLRDGRCGTDRTALESLLNLNPQTAQGIRETEVLFIDEISMISERVFQQTDIICQIANANSKPFGGIQVVVCGDFYQLAPVPDPYVGDDGGYAFDSSSWKAMKFAYVHLTDVKRCHDLNLSRCVDELSKGIISDASETLIQTLLSRPRPPLMSSVTLCGTNEECDRVNHQCLNELPGDSKCYTSSDRGDCIVLDRIAPKVVVLKVGARIILTTNLNIDLKLVNGRSGVVSSLGGDVVEVILDGESNPVTIKKFKFSSPRGSRVQLPLKLSWARTIHRTQSLTVKSKVHVVLSKLRQPGQLAVALSRVQCSTDLSASGTFQRPPERGEVTAFYYTMGDDENCSSTSCSDDEDSSECDSMPSAPVQSTLCSNTVPSMEYVGDNEDEKQMWNVLANFYTQANIASNKAKVYSNLVESFMYSSNYESIVNRIGRSEAFRIWVAVRKKFVTFCKDQDADQTEPSASGTQTNAQTVGCLPTKNTDTNLAGDNEDIRQLYAEANELANDNKLRTNKYSSTVIKQAKTCLEDDESLKTHFCELCPLSESEEKVMKDLYLIIVKHIVDTGSYEFRKKAVERCVKKRTLREEVRRATNAKKKSKNDKNMEFCSLCNLTDEHDVDGTNWIQCQQCHRWFHQQCLKLSSQQFKEAADNEQWVCPICESISDEENESDSEQEVE